MNMMSQVSGQKPQQNKVALATDKTPYATPKLRFYGSVGALTMSGTGSAAETVANQGSCSPNLNRRSCV